MEQELNSRRGAEVGGDDWRAILGEGGDGATVKQQEQEKAEYHQQEQTEQNGRSRREPSKELGKEGGRQVPEDERYRSKMAFCGWEVLGFVEGCFVGDSKL
jgi:hypothetical protein